MKATKIGLVACLAGERLEHSVMAVGIRLEGTVPGLEKSQWHGR